MITIDELRGLEGRIKVAGQGAIKYHVGDESYHFYDGTTHEVRNTGIHQHYGGFKSHILKGELKNYIYTIDGTDPDSTLQLIRKKDKTDTQYALEQDTVNLITACSFSTRAGESYYIHYQTYHSIEMMAPKVVTHIRRIFPNMQPTIGYITDTTMPTAYENTRMTENEKWEIVEDILND